ncbi:hypothetical protein PG994_001131 [Apiospora phragmitis]|uniref:AGC-kinase C-terminal domain-containing protein n=1 Tax=Apiospora phragmitis TaxID=2905665 RepID=A0ABR1WSN0_9PEZI
MLSHLRFHRRGPSNPSSPIPDSNASSWDVRPPQLVPDDSSVPAPDIRPRSSTSGPPSQQAQARPQSPSLTSPPPPPAPPQPQQAPPPPPPSQAPPSLPPIARVASVSETEYSESVYSVYVGDPDSQPREEPRPPVRSPSNEHTGFLGGLKYRREQDAAAAAATVASPRPGPSERSPSYSLDSRNSSRPNIASAVTSPPGRPPLRSSNVGSFVSPTHLQHNNNTGKRPQGARITMEPPPSSNQSMAQDPPPPPPKGKKGLPFLKNPMSTLLMRRKTSQNIPDLSLSLLNDRGKNSYEPIRGTKVHDFSAPRPKKPVSNSVSPMVPTEKAVPDASLPSKDDMSPPQRPAPPVPPKDDREQSGRSSVSIRSRRPVSVDGAPAMQGESMSSTVSASASRRITLMDPQEMRRKSSVPSSISTLSRNLSGMSSKDVLSALPRHMKSTSSRFSFDMMGAANAEKLLEERHRQREQDKQPDIPGHRDSRFDEFDEDPFEYDDLDYDDGLEERIPGVNADYDEEEEDIYEEPVEEYDPDNDQDNFAGFVFQRSNPHSNLASPQDPLMATTPRDAEGNIIGFAMTQGTSDINNRLSQASIQAPQPSQPHSPVSQALRSGDSPTGLGIQGLDAAIHDSDRSSPQQNQQKENPVPETVPAPVSAPLQPDDELYFGGAGLEGEGDGLAIDEALFDLEDTDQYGRPLPGVFANALARRQAAEEQAKRESDDVTSRLSGASAITQSTAHTSVSVVPKQEEPLPIGNQADNEKSSPDGPDQPNPECVTTESNNMAAYQAALAAAAHKAAASGKFRRDSDPPPPADVTITSPTTSGSDQSNANIDSFDDYEFDDGFDDGFGNGLDDYELDDDAIIAEANASALAHDSDGWYGQEFGFYAAPAQPIPHRNTNPGSDTDPFYGGFFGSNNGLARSKSGHLISREPNLTPITERSEYSNRNSIMSLMSPNSTTNRELSSLQSPGLAQLAMMADDDNMSLSALLRLRSKAWGDSQASLSLESRGAEQIPSHDMYGRKNSAFSVWSQSAESGAASGSGSPTLTMSIPMFPNNSAAVPPLPPLNPATAMGGTNPNSAAGPVPSAIPQPLFSPPPPPLPPTIFPPVLEDEEADDDAEDLDDRASAASAGLKPSPLPAADYSSTLTSSSKPGVPSQQRPAGGMDHRHKGSADSISYTREEGGGDEPRWVLERRRTADSGEMEVLEREVVEGGRISGYPRVPSCTTLAPALDRPGCGRC